jgi:predicted ATP-dependent endonuclease of OLD family
VGIDRIDQIRLLRKGNNGTEKPKITKVVSTSLDLVAEDIWKADGETGPKYTGTTIAHRLQAIMTPWMSEGFFSDVVVLVEGEDDRAAILGAAKAMGHELEGSGYSVIPCGGKTNIDRPYVIFKKLGIPVYVIWDGDFGKGASGGKCEKCSRPLDKKPDPKENRRLLRLLGRDETDWPEFIEDAFACFKYDLETTLMEEIGLDPFEKYLTECQADFCILKRKHAIKNPNVILNIMNKAAENGNSSKTITTIVNKILAMK